MVAMSVELDSVPIADASTLVLIRESPDRAMEVLLVRRSAKSAFLGGAIVFPGGRVEPSDAAPDFTQVSSGLPTRGLPFGQGCAAEGPQAALTEGRESDVSVRARACGIAGMRESLEEAAVLPVVGAHPTHAELLAARDELEAGNSFLQVLRARAWQLDLLALAPLCRWVTPKGERRRFDTRFFLCAVPSATRGAHDARETTESYWAAPRAALDDFEKGAIDLAPPTHAVLSVLSGLTTVECALAWANTADLRPVMPEIRMLDGSSGPELCVVLPGDPLHSSPARIGPWPLRFVLRGGRFVPLTET